MRQKDKEFDMKLRSVEYILAAFTLPARMTWLETRLKWHENAKGKRVLAPVLVKDGYYHKIEFASHELRGLALYTVTSRIRNEIEKFQLELKLGKAPKLEVNKADGIE